MKRRLLFVKKQHVEALRDGSRQHEIRAGQHYKHIDVGDELVINGRQLRLKVSRIVAFPDVRSCAHALDEDVKTLRGLYPTQRPFFAFFFDPPCTEEGTEASDRVKTPA